MKVFIHYDGPLSRNRGSLPGIGGNNPRRLEPGNRGSLPGKTRTDFDAGSQAGGY